LKQKSPNMKTKSIIKKEHSAQGLQLLSSNIESLTKKLLGQAGFVQLELIKNWPDIVGENLAQNSLPERIDYKKGERAAGTLVLSVSSGAFALEISHISPIIIEKINAYFGYFAVQKIHIIQKNNIVHAEKKSNIADIEKKKLVTQEQQNYIDSVGEGINDEALKSKLRSLALSILCAQKKEN